MKKYIALFLSIAFGISLSGQELNPIMLLKPDKTRGLPVMKALDVRASTREWSTERLNLQDLSDLVWAANGINRPDEGKRTTSSAMNAQDIDIYAFMVEGIYLYDAKQHLLNPVGYEKK